MQLFNIVIICFVGLSHGFEEENPLQALTRVQLARVAGDCNNPGINSNAICVSQTKFIYNGDPLDAPPLECEAGKVCVDLPGICFSGMEPLCPNTVPLDPAKPLCAICGTNAPYACISQNAYAGCSGGQPMTQYARQCAAGAFCKIDTSGSTSASPCAAGNTAATADCSNTVVPPPPPATPAPGSGSSACRTLGLFPKAGDITCKGYYSCAGSNGHFVKADYICSESLVFNPTIQRCVLTTDYNCPS